MTAAVERDVKFQLCRTDFKAEIFTINLLHRMLWGFSHEIEISRNLFNYLNFNETSCNCKIL